MLHQKHAHGNSNNNQMKTRGKKGIKFRIKYQTFEIQDTNYTVLLIIIKVFSLKALSNQNKVNPGRAKKASSIQYGNKKSRTCAGVFSHTLAPGTSRNERQRNR